MITRVKTVAIYVDDQKKSLEFYTAKLGFEIRRRLPMGPDADWVELAPPGAPTLVVIYPRAMMKNWEAMKPSIVFACDDLEATHTELAGRGVTFTEKPVKTDWGGYAKFLDPDGNEFVLVPG